MARFFELLDEVPGAVWLGIVLALALYCLNMKAAMNAAFLAKAQSENKQAMECQVR